ncbi:hypothetical protein L914_21476 [Phytophthora nicotianae]|uniref:Uncharacterized protein n=1 Tax=Phytophthora nicotianae TaxID=4792 RepID=W2M5T0_PHYNI|nr:hypothetical protein L914_21476 [Phytophthora nicotianae]
MSTGGGTSTGPQYGSTKPPKYDEKGGFDLYRAMLESFRTQRERWGIVDGTDVLAKICTMTYARQMWLAFELETTKRNYSNSLFVRKKFYSYEYKAVWAWTNT